MYRLGDVVLVTDLFVGLDVGSVGIVHVYWCDGVVLELGDVIMGFVLLGFECIE